MGLPGLAGAEHIGITVPDLEAATRFFVDVIGCKVAFEIGPFASDDDSMQQHLGVDPRSRNQQAADVEMRERSGDRIVRI